jgi:microsomal dipeptidase-like Zn-dependent dipeptidase
LHEQATLVDLHAHPSLAAMIFHRTFAGRYRAISRAFNPFSVRTNFIRLAEGAVDVLLSVAYPPEKQILDDISVLGVLRLRHLRYVPWPPLWRIWRQAIQPPYFQVANNFLDEIEHQVKTHNRQRGKRRVEIATSIRQLDEIVKQGKHAPIALIHAMEGAHGLEGEVCRAGDDEQAVTDELLANLDRLYQRGVAYITLAHFYANRVAPPVFPFPEYMLDFYGGPLWRDLTHSLTPAGEKVVEEMVGKGMIVDVTHCTPTARRRVYDIVGKRRPILATHVGVYEINPSPFNLTDWEIRRIAETGGMLGVICMNHWLVPHEAKLGVSYIARTIEHIVNVAGVESVGIGTDFDGFTDPPDDLKEPGELPRLTERLLAERYSHADIMKILGGNALRVLRQGWGKRE